MSSLQQYPFIFSNEPNFRIRRHLALWVSWWLFAGFLYSPVTYVLHLSYLRNLMRSLLESFAFLPIHIFLAYTLIYFVVPYFLLKGKYALTIVMVVLSFACCALLSVLIANTIIPTIRGLFDARNFPPGYFQVQFQYAFMAGLRGGITVGGLAAAIKLMKHWYVQGQKNLELQKENAESQLQLLKAQVHPHFLFNTLNNIYSKTQKTAPDASEMIFGLSDILRYMLYDCNKPLVPLAQELKMISEYINLEKVRYGNKLEIHVEWPGDTKDYFIAPLLLLPFVENSFKHGTSNMLEQPWINLAISIEEEQMTMKVVNSRCPQEPDSKRGIGVSNVKKRLELLYPGRHELSICEEDDVFIVILRLQLEKHPVQPAPVKSISYVTS